SFCANAHWKHVPHAYCLCICRLPNRDPSKVQDGKVQASPKRAVDTKLKRRIDEYLDLETNLKEREILLKKAFREGYWDDAKEIAKKGVKLWEAPKKMTPSHLAPRFFDVTAKTLAGNTTSIYELVPKASATLVTFVNSGIASEHIDTYIAPFVKEFGGNDKVQIVQIHAEDNWAKSVAMQLFLPSLRRRLVKEQWGKYLLCYKDISDDRRKIGISNRLLGWVHLVDSQCKLRWQAHGPATADETETLIESTKKLLERAERE
ncbi:ATPase assembly factor ATP10, partial [Polychytrium aggregatum]|uniref:ATPase assembly factor ATP10 n=1 Tax=Polychytrium aggregatum TaxID=110093 RepID=UPI0022FE4ADB